MSLYPLKFSPILKSIIWGGEEICKFKNITPHQSGIGESWEISGVENNISVVAEGKLKGQKLDDLISQYRNELVGKSVYEKYGNTFPLLIKFIDARDNLSIQVHPDDTLGMARHNSFGKTEMWYVINAQKGASLYSGFSKAITPEKYLDSMKDDTFVDYLDRHEVKSGDVFFLPAGRVHAIGAGVFVAEIQQTSNITYRIYDYNRKDINGNSRELHIDLAKDAIDYGIYDNHKNNYSPKKDEAVLLETCQYFTTNILELKNKKERDYNDIDSFVILICVEGTCSIKDNKNNTVKIHQGESLLIPANTKNIVIDPTNSVRLLETYVQI